MKAVPADCAASPWSDQVLLAHRHRGCLNGGCSPALSDYAAAADTLGPLPTWRAAGDVLAEEEAEKATKQD